MADTSRWRLAKRVFTAILADGISLDADPDVLDAWAQEFSARDAEGRREVLGELMDQHPEYATGRVLIHDGQVAVLRAGMPAVKHLVWPDLACDCGCDQPVTFPPVALPDPTVLAKSVAGDGAALVHPPASASAPKGMERLHDWLKPWMPRFLGLLYAANAAGEPADLGALTEQLLVEYVDRLPPGDPELFASIAAITVRQALAD